MNSLRALRLPWILDLPANSFSPAAGERGWGLRRIDRPFSCLEEVMLSDPIQRDGRGVRKRCGHAGPDENLPFKRPNKLSSVKSVNKVVCALGGNHDAKKPHHG